MTRYMVLYRASTSAAEQMAKATPEQARAGMEAWMKWASQAGDAIVDLGSPLGETVTVTGDSVSEGRSELGGYSILQAESRDGVVELLREHPHLHMPGGSIEVHEFLPPPGS
jgi:hypothetical protein